MKKRPLIIEEQETIISINRAEDTARIYTSDDLYRTRLKRLYGDKLVKVYRRGCDPVAEEYEIDKRLISFRRVLPINISKKS